MINIDLQVVKIIIGFISLYFMIDGIYNWRRSGPLYLTSVSAMTLAIFWSYISMDFFSGWTRSLNSTVIAVIELAAFSLFIFIQIKHQKFDEKMQSLSDRELVNQFAEGAKRHTQYVESKDEKGLKESRRGFSEMKNAYFELKRRDSSLVILRKLLGHESDAVRMWSARRLLDKYQEESLAVLDAMRNGSNYVSMK